jgi:hypothetical protein
MSLRNGEEIANFINLSLQEKYQHLYFFAEYNSSPNRNLSIVFYNTKKEYSQEIISEAGHIHILMTGFDINNNVNRLVAKVVKSKEIEEELEWKNKRGKVEDVLNYTIKNFKRLNLEKITNPMKNHENKKM